MPPSSEISVLLTYDELEVIILALQFEGRQDKNDEAELIAKLRTYLQLSRRESMTTVDQFLKALAVVESSDDPEAWGDAGRAMGRWQCHPDRWWTEMHALGLKPQPGETWDQTVARILRAIFAKEVGPHSPVAIAMYWHKGHWCADNETDWDAKYAARFGAALANAKDDMP